MLQVLLLAACASQPPVPPRPPRTAIEAFDIEARLSIRNDQQVQSAHITWRHRADVDEILVTGPLGQGMAELRRDAGGAHLRTADRRETSAADWSALGEKVFGAVLPLDELPHWITGQVSGAETDDLGRPLRGVRDGWRVEFTEYESPRADALPTSIHIGRGDIAVKVRVDSWQLP